MPEDEKTTQEPSPPKEEQVEKEEIEGEQTPEKSKLDKAIESVEKVEKIEQNINAALRKMEEGIADMAIKGRSFAKQESKPKELDPVEYAKNFHKQEGNPFFPDE